MNDKDIRKRLEEIKKREEAYWRPTAKGRLTTSEYVSPLVNDMPWLLEKIETLLEEGGEIRKATIEECAIRAESLCRPTDKSFEEWKLTTIKTQYELPDGELRLLFHAERITSRIRALSEEDHGSD